MVCSKLHDIAQKAKRFHFINGKLPDSIPKNGIYLLFENGERGHTAERIVRVGTHNGDNRLVGRLHDHFINPYKDSSIFRKHLGRCFIMIDGNPNNYLDIWNIDFKNVENKRKYSHLRDTKYEEILERKITSRIQQNFTFACIRVAKKDERLKLEGKIISTVKACIVCNSSDSWLGNHIPDKQKKIRLYGLWLINKLDGEQLNQKDIFFIKDNIVG